MDLTIKTTALEGESTITRALGIEDGSAARVLDVAFTLMEKYARDPRMSEPETSNYAMADAIREISTVLADPAEFAYAIFTMGTYAAGTDKEHSSSNTIN